jgi:hypothetical protein
VIKRKPRGQTVTSPFNFPVEVSMMFERAAYAPLRVPEAGKGFDTHKAAYAARLVMARWKAQILRSPECPKAFADLIRMTQFESVQQDSDGWCYYIRPFAGSVMEVAKGVVGEAVPADEFWKTYRQEGA